MAGKKAVSVKERTYEIESRFLSPYAQKSAETKGRARTEAPCEFRTDFQRDRDRVIYSNSFKRLKNKTQVFFAPEGDHYITRLTHTLDVAQISRSIARALSLNEDLAEAIALGHDLGHTPFGHVGERVLDKLCPFGFEHNVQSLRVVDYIEKDGRGLNLTQEVRDGILQHKSTGHPATLEGVAVSLADRIAYINHDIEDAIRAGILQESDLPQRAVETLGHATRERINTAITDIYTHSVGTDGVRMSDEVAKATFELRTFMFKNIYALTNKSMQDRAERMLTAMYEYFLMHTDRLPKQYLKLGESAPKEQIVCDYLSGMTDRYAINVFESLFIPETFSLGGVTV
ncbi:MAG: deoxyguanosinetriphosphate triphosphohydrolase [Firmicutes bacterium]|jgi:putative dGTPase|nr:deoxyguanosinetriphosphate triphosphohydrolase [Bacillota bacterium]